jgi:hypothetical protein
MPAISARSASRFLGVQKVKLALQQAHDDVGFRDQILQLVVNTGCAHAFLPHGFGLGR